MDNLKVAAFAGAVAVLLGIAGVSYIAPSKEDFVELKENLGALSSPDVYSYLFVHGPFGEGGGLYTVAQVTSTVTLSGSSMADANRITFTASSTQAALTATLPATTTFPLPAEPGARRSWIIENPFLAAATTTTIAAGTGIDLQEPDGQNVVIGINNYAVLDCFREASTDIVCIVDETIPAD